MWGAFLHEIIRYYYYIPNSPTKLYLWHFRVLHTDFRTWSPQSSEVWRTGWWDLLTTNTVTKKFFDRKGVGHLSYPQLLVLLNIPEIKFYLYFSKDFLFLWHDKLLRLNSLEHRELWFIHCIYYLSLINQSTA